MSVQFLTTGISIVYDPFFVTNGAVAAVRSLKGGKYNRRAKQAYSGILEGRGRKYQGRVQCQVNTWATPGIKQLVLLYKKNNNQK